MSDIFECVRAFRAAREPIVVREQEVTGAESETRQAGPSRVNAPGRPALPGRPSARGVLRQATGAVHERLHRHPAFAALGEGRIARADYRALLARLHGFHAPLETALMAVATGDPFGIDMASRARAGQLRLDLLDLGLDERSLAALPRLPRLPDLGGPGRVLGCLYVREGATLGGRLLARRLDHVLAPGPAGRRFLSGGDRHAELWQAFCAALEQAADEGHLADMVAGATETFTLFDAWFADPGWLARPASTRNPWRFA